jgi:hypothetical protein
VFLLGIGCSALRANTTKYRLFRLAGTQCVVSGIVVQEYCPQASHAQWWRISPPSTNSDMRGATIVSAQRGH